MDQSDRLSERLEAATSEVFERPSGPPPVGSTSFLPDAWDTSKYGLTRPLFESSFEGSESLREEFVRGAEHLGIDGKRRSVMPHQWAIADMLNAVKPDGRPLHRTNVLGIPRRGTKSTTVFALGLGRCLSRDGYLFAFTGQSGLKARDRFLRDIVGPLERKFPDPDTRPFKINRSRGSEHIDFDNGSLLAVLPPVPDSWRGDAWDLVFIDEAQSHAPEDGTELVAAIRPTFLGHPEAQLVIAGTAGKHKSGILWDYLERGRNGEIGILEFGASPETPVYDPDEDESTDGTHADPDIWRAAHPRLTHDFTPEEFLEDFTAMTTAEFMAEYLNIWPDDGSTNFLSASKWNACRLPTPSAAAPPAFVPTRFAWALAVHPEQRSASIVQASRDEHGLAHITLVDHRPGTKWVAARIKELAAKHPNVPMLYDSASSPALVELEPLKWANPRPQLEPQTWNQVSVAAGLFVKQLETLSLRHYDQPAMNMSCSLVIKRGTYKSTKWAFGRANAGDDITPIEAASLALRYYDEQPAPAPLLRPTL